MACTITNLAPLGRPCTPQMGGVKYVYLITDTDLDQDSVHVREIVDRAGLWGLNVRGRDADLSGAAAVDYLENDRGLGVGDLPVYRIDVTRQGAVVTSEATVNRDNNTVFYRNAVTMPTVGLTPDAVGLLQKLGTGGCIVVAAMYTGQLVAFGFSERATIDAASLTTGANWSDMPGATITLAAEEAKPILADAAWIDDHGYFLAARDNYIETIFRNYGNIA